MNKPTVFISETSITVVHQGKSKITILTTDLGKCLLDLYNKSQLELMPELITSHEIIDNMLVKQDSMGNLVIDGVLVERELADKVREVKKKGLPFDNLLEFSKKVMENPSFNSRKMLYKFLNHNGHPICKNGNFIAYKKVTSDFTDLHTGQFDNSIGRVVTINRNLVDDNPNNTCSSGLHVASFDFAEGFGSGKLVMVEVDPKDVVAVPTDYNGTKMRVCRYTVLCETEESLEGVYTKVESKVFIGDAISFLGQSYEVVDLYDDRMVISDIFGDYTDLSLDADFIFINKFEEE